MDYGLARPVPLLLAVALAALACLATASDARAVRVAAIRVPAEGNMTISRIELRASRPATLGRGRISTPRLRVRNARRAPRDLKVFAAVRRQRRRGRFSAFFVVLNPSGSRRSAAAQNDDYNKVELFGNYNHRRVDEGIDFDVRDDESKTFPNVFNANSPFAGNLAERLFERADVGPCRILYFGRGSRRCPPFLRAGVEAAQDNPISPSVYRVLRGLSPLRRDDVQSFRLPPGPGEGSRSLVSFLYNQPVEGVLIQSAPGQSIVTLDSGTQGFQCLIIDPSTGECTFADPGTGASFVFGFTPGVSPGEPMGNMFPILPPHQPIRLIGTDAVLTY